MVIHEIRSEKKKNIGPSSPVGPGKMTLRALTERTILRLAAPTGALVNDRGDILYLHGPTGMYLEPASCTPPVNNILLMAREGLQQELTSAMHTTLESGEISRRPGLKVSSNGAFTTANLTISPVVTGPDSTNETPLYLILLEEVAKTDKHNTATPSGSDSSESETNTSLSSLREELRTKNEDMQTASRKHTSSNKAMKSINAELHSANDELQLVNEELQKAFDAIKTLRGIIPICAHCKNIQDDNGLWIQVEVYVRNHSKAVFSHGICPHCLKKHYPDLKTKGSDS